MNKDIEKINSILKDFQENLPKFSDGRIDYSESKIALSLSCFVKFDGKILLLKRSDKVSFYKNVWNSVAGYIDDLSSIENKIYEELREEVQISPSMIKKMSFGQIYEFNDDNISRSWIILPVLIDLNFNPKIEIDWEHTEYKWIDPSEIDDYETVPNLEITMSRLI